MRGFIISLALVVITLYTLPAEIRADTYYFYVPASSNMTVLDEIVNGTRITIAPPNNVALLDVIGLHNNTEVNIWELPSNRLFASFKIGKLEKRTIFVPCNKFFKVTSNYRILLYLQGGSQYHNLGTSSFYPSIKGGFRGKEFVLIPTTIPDIALTSGKSFSNLIIFSLKENTLIEVKDSSGGWRVENNLDKYGVATYRLWCRIKKGSRARGLGNSILFFINSSSDVLVMSLAPASFMAIPSLEGGFVGKVFFVPVHSSTSIPGSKPLILIVPTQPCLVSIYDTKLNTIGNKKFSLEDVNKNTFWLFSPKKSEGFFIIKSTGNITVLAGSTYGGKSLEYLGDDITFIGIRPNQEAKIYVPTKAIIFVLKSTIIEIDNSTTNLDTGEYLILSSGVHTIKPNESVVVEILGNSTGWRSWGSYIISFSDIAISYKVPKGFAEKGGWWSPWMTVGIIVVIIVIVIILAKIGILSKIISILSGGF